MKAVVKSWNDGAAQHAAAAVERHRLAFDEAKDELCRSQLSVKPLCGIRDLLLFRSQTFLGPDANSCAPRASA